VLWTRTPGPPEAPDYPDGSDEAALAHHYSSGPVRGRFTARAPFPCYDFFAPLLPDRSLCPACAQSFPTPWLGSPGTPSGFGFPPCSPAPGAAPGIAIPGALLDAGPSFATDPLPLLAVEGKWIAASEPDEWLPRQGVRYASVLPDGRLERVLVQTLQGLAELGIQPNEPVVEPFAAAVAPEAGDAAPPSVLSARRQLLWTFTAESAHVLDLRSGARRPFGIGGESIGEVVAATYDPASDSLAVLDEVSRAPGGGSGRGRGSRTARLLRIERV